MPLRDVFESLCAGLVFSLAWTALALAQPSLPAVQQIEQHRIAPIRLDSGTAPPMAPKPRAEPAEADRQRVRSAIGNRIDGQIRREFGDGLEFQLNEIESLRLQSRHADIAAWGLLLRDAHIECLVRVDLRLDRRSLQVTGMQLERMVSSPEDAADALVQAAPEPSPRA